MNVEVRIDYDRCVGCRECVKACSYGVLGWLDDMPIVVNPQKCKACAECSASCPVDAISVDEK